MTQDGGTHFIYGVNGKISRSTDQGFVATFSSESGDDLVRTHVWVHHNDGIVYPEDAYATLSGRVIQTNRADCHFAVLSDQALACIPLHRLQKEPWVEELVRNQKAWPPSILTVRSVFPVSMLRESTGELMVSSDPNVVVLDRNSKFESLRRPGSTGLVSAWGQGCGFSNSTSKGLKIIVQDFLFFEATLSGQEDVAPKPAAPVVVAEMVKCPLCADSAPPIRSDRLESHKKRVHLKHENVLFNEGAA